ncbi:MAG TPA: FtsQ-type POTRA domain-containing protein [Candidatus Acidoferrales bacterium]|nr:FtsQ-type POTRA domain-containing protein [Candidatus Acidoferrales bacterium]
MKSEKLRKRDADAYPQEAVVEDEPRYLRRQKPIDIRRRKFGRKAWKTYLRASLLFLFIAAAASVLYGVGDYLFTSPEMALASPSQVELSGNFYVTRSSVLEIFSPDRGRGVLRIPLAQRRAQIEALPWVEHAEVLRALPNHIEVDITERKPIAFLRQGPELMLVDAHGVILDRPLEGDFHFPVVTGITAQLPRDERALRMQMFADFMSRIRPLRAGAVESVSEVDLSDPSDLRATLAGLPGMGKGLNSATDAILVHFGNSDFGDKFQVLLDNISQWEAAAGRIASVDLRFQKEVVVNPEVAVDLMETPPAPAPRPKRAKATKPAKAAKHPVRLKKRKP